jgi:hypothetical protein
VPAVLATLGIAGQATARSTMVPTRKINVSAHYKANKATIKYAAKEGK